MSKLSVRNLSIDYQTDTRVVHAVRNISFDVAPGERVGLVGESGSGKTTTALALMRMIKSPGKIAGGEAVLGDIDLLALSGDEIRQARLNKVAYIPQGAMNSLNPVLSVADQILDGLADHGCKLRGKEAATFVAELLESVGLPATVAKSFPHQLSGGMKQRVCIAIGVAMNPELIIADEPTSALDVITQRQIMQTLIAVQGRIGCGLVLIGHDMGLMAQATDRIIVMQDGCIVEDASVDKIFSTPEHSYSKLLIESVPVISSDRPHAQPVDDSDDRSSDLLAFDGVSKTFGGGLLGSGGKVALRNCSFALKENKPQIISIVGQSGSGKSTLARMVLGFETPSTGRVLYRGQSVSAMKGKEQLAFRREVQAVFQDPYGSFNPFYKVDRPLANSIRNFGLASSRQDIYAIMEKACDAVGLNAAEVLGRFPHELSGGQRQRLMVARALMLNPKLIVADEPVSMVDASQRMSILGNLQKLKDEHQISVIYITHDLATAYHISDYVLVLHAGRIVEAGEPKCVIEAPQHAYTQSLVGAIPWPDPAMHWQAENPELIGKWDLDPVLHGNVDGFVLRDAA